MHAAKEMGVKMAGSVISYEERSGIATICLDDGKANAMQHAWCSEFNAALDRAEQSDVASLIVTGRPGFFSGGLDLKLLPTLAGSEVRATTDLFMETMKRVFLFPKPVIAASSGHAIAGGMMLFLAADWRLALDDDRHRYGLNEATTGVPMLGGTVGICQYSIPPAHHTEFILHGRLLSGRQCFERQVVQELVSAPGDLEGRARARCEELKDLEPGAYRTNKLILRREAFEQGVRIAQSLMSEAPKKNVFKGMSR